MAKMSAYIDVANLLHGGNAVNIRIDYAKFKPILVGTRAPVDLNFYDCTQNLPKQNQFFDRMRDLGYNVKLTRIHSYNGAQLEEKKIDTRIVADSIVDGLVEKKIDTAVFCSGDKDLKPAIDYLMQAGIQVEIASFEHCLAWELRLCGAKIINLTTIAPLIRKI